MSNNTQSGILSFLDSHAQEQVQFVIELCNQNSYTYNKVGTDRIAIMILEHLDGILPLHETIRQDEIGDHHLLRTANTFPSIYLLGHMDTVFPPDHPYQKCSADNDNLIGPGTADMKGGLAVIVYALKALAAVNLLNTLNLTVILSSDEEIGAATSHAMYEAEREKAVACFVAECGGRNGELVVSRNGKMGVRIDCTGQDRHVGLDNETKASAILELAHKVVVLESLNGCLPGIRLNVGKIEGGLGPGTIPDKASCLVDMRWVEQQHQDSLLKRVNDEISHAYQPGCTTQLHILNSRPAMPLTEATTGLFEMVRTVGQSIGQRIEPSHRRGTSDANFFGSAGVPTLDGLGPLGEKDHTPDEFIKLSSLKDRAKLLALSLIEFGRQAGMIPR